MNGIGRLAAAATCVVALGGCEVLSNPAMMPVVAGGLGLAAGAAIMGAAGQQRAEQPNIVIINNNSAAAVGYGGGSSFQCIPVEGGTFCIDPRSIPRQR